MEIEFGFTYPTGFQDLFVLERPKLPIAANLRSLGGNMAGRKGLPLETGI